MIHTRKILVISLLMFLSGVGSADTLLIQSLEKHASVDRPNRGISMAQVTNQYGDPVKKFAAIGEPPITKWKYANITVYFEHDHVIHSVVNRKK